MNLLNEFETSDLASCPHCRSVVALARYVDGRIFLWDPKFSTRRWLVTAIGIGRWIEWLEAGQSWGHRYDSIHECPPASLRSYLPMEDSGRDVRLN